MPAYIVAVKDNGLVEPEQNWTIFSFFFCLYKPQDDTISCITWDYWIITSVTIITQSHTFFFFKLHWEKKTWMWHRIGHHSYLLDNTIQFQIQGEKKALQSQHMEQSMNPIQSRWSTGHSALQCRPYSWSTVQAQVLRRSLNVHSGGWREQQKRSQRNEHNQYGCLPGLVC